MLTNPLDFGQFSLLEFQPPDPAAGANYVFPVPIGTLYELICLSFLFSTDAGVGNRYLSLNIENPSRDIYFKAPLVKPFVANTTNQLSFGAGFSHASQGDAHVPTTGSWPLHLLVPGPHLFVISVLGIKVGDAFTDISGWFHQRIITRA